MRLALLIVVASVTVSQGLSQYYPAGLSSCVNHNETTNTSLVINCRGRKMNSSILSQELNVLLSDDDLREHLTSLNISNTSLTQVR